MNNEIYRFSCRFGEFDWDDASHPGHIAKQDTGREEQERIENLARRALRELYDLTGYQVEECFYGYNEIGMLVFARKEEDMEHSRVFYSYNMGEKDGYDNIPSIDIVSARRVWYSDICLKLTMEDGTFYEIEMDMEIMALNNIYDPYLEGAQH